MCQAVKRRLPAWPTAPGVFDSTDVRVFSTDVDRTRPLFDADMAGVGNWDLFEVARSRDGVRLLASGHTTRPAVVAWAGAGRGAGLHTCLPGGRR